MMEAEKGRNGFALPHVSSGANGGTPFFPDIKMLMAVGAKQRSWHECAAETATARFGRNVFVRAVVEVSNFCRENCRYCGMRRDNRSLDRYRARHDEMAELLIRHRPSSVTDVNIQSGEDPLVVEKVVLPLIHTLRRETPLGISVCLGTLNSSFYNELRAAGASIYIIKFELADAVHYEKMQAPGNLSERLDHIRLLARSGWRVSSGFIAGLPDQTADKLLANFGLARELPLDGCSVSPFIPGDETPLTQAPAGDLELTLNCMAALRLMRPDWIIPAVSALNIAGPNAGYRRGLRTGANLVTINLTPPDLRTNYLLYKRERFIMTEERILSALEAESLMPSSQSLADFYRSRAAATEAGQRSQSPAAVTL